MRNPTSKVVPGSGRERTKGVARQKKMTRRQFLKSGAAVIFGSVVAGGAYASLWEPHQLDITRLTLTIPSLPNAFDGLKLVQFSDLHLGFQAGEKEVMRVVQAIQHEDPDLICFTGDMVDRDAEEMRAAIEPFKELTAPLGMYSILGNHDYKDVKKLVSLEEEAGFQVLRNTAVKLRRGSAVIAVVGLEDGLRGLPDPAAAIQGLPQGMFKLLLMHEPDYADTASAHSFHLQLSGHSHGGQVRLPWVGEVLTPPGARRYVQGLYHIGSRRMPLYVNRGIGTTQLPIRFLCKPELTVLTLRSKP
ncbi:metallophosphoesterase [Paenibacillus solani]|uniref:Phosphoesterase n=1 Tax=Paenibacillus solani TaxID=1705565 RepID=A0A0M1NKD3_9BACL|nr:metallophosphoesterase [Paenibacillus solani]KOR82567.1 phosphoesterase [Paenibacillus solani]